MKLSPIITQIKTWCPSFSGRVAGAAEFKMLPESAALAAPCAFVIPLDDNPQGSISQNGVRQQMQESFAVIIAVSNTTDERGQSSADAIHLLRKELWAALLGFRPTEDGGGSETSRYDGINYEGGSLLALDRARMWFQFEFGAAMEIEPSDGWQAREEAALPHFDGATISVDFIDPIADPNVQYPGPDDRIETVITIPKTGNLP